MDKVILKFKGRVILWQYIPKKRKCVDTKIYKLYDESGYTYDMRVYLGKDSHFATDDMTAAHATVRQVYMLNNMDPTPAEGNFCDNSNRLMKPHIVEWYNRHMCYVDNS